LEIKSSLFSGETPWRVSGKDSISLSKVERILSKREEREGFRVSSWGVVFLLLITFLFLDFLPKVRIIYHITKYYKILHYSQGERSPQSPESLWRVSSQVSGKGYSQSIPWRVLSLSRDSSQVSGN